MAVAREANVRKYYQVWTGTDTGQSIQPIREYLSKETENYDEALKDYNEYVLQMEHRIKDYKYGMRLFVYILGYNELNNFVTLKQQNFTNAKFMA